MNSKNLMKNAYKYYDEKYDKYNKILTSYDKVTEETFESDLKESIIRFYKNDKVILEANYEGMGDYYSNENLFVWTWAIVNSNKNMSYISKSILKYGLDITLNNPSETNEYNLNSFLKMLLINSRILITNQVELDILTYISFYLSKKDYFTSFKDDNIFRFIYLYNIKMF
tara:strand:- start:7615 stop:8124 length:510 start_codon:yes stop_codon:yes gene_type:complete